MAKNKISLADVSRYRKQINETGESSSSITERSDNNEPLQSITDNTNKTNSVESEEVSTNKIVESNPDTINNNTKNQVLTATRKPGRPKSLSSNPEYESTTIFLKRDIKAKVRYHLAIREKKKDLQVLVNELLKTWLEQQD